MTTHASLRFEQPPLALETLLITSFIIDLGSKVEDNIIVTSTNNPSAILGDIRVANTTSSISSSTSRIFGTKSTLIAKKGLAKRVNSKRS